MNRRQFFDAVRCRFDERPIYTLEATGSVGAIRTKFSNYQAALKEAKRWSLSEGVDYYVLKDGERVAKVQRAFSKGSKIIPQKVIKL